MNMSKVYTKDSQICTALRYPLMCGIVMIHARFSLESIQIIDPDFDLDSCSFCFLFSRLISQIVCAVCVPLFYFISGYLFFLKSSFSFNTYISKLKRRFHSLFIPYVFWNASILLFYLGAQILIPSFISSRNIPILDYTFSDILWAFWDVSKVNHSGPTFPIGSQFWFIRNLMITVIFSIDLFCNKKIKYVFLLLLGICWIFNFWPAIPGFGIEAFLFFSLGSFFSINDKSFIRCFAHSFPINLWIYFILAIVTLLFWNTNTTKEYLLKFSILFEMAALFGLFTNIKSIVNFFNCHQSFPNSSFFLFAYHFLPLVLLNRMLLKFVPYQNNLSFLLIYLIPPLIIIFIGYFLYRFLKHRFPKFTAIITGGR